MRLAPWPVIGKQGGRMQIHWTHCEEVPADVRSAVESRLQALAREQGDLVDVHLVGHATNHHRLGGRELRITCQARGRDIVASCERPELGQALNEAIDDFERRVRRARERRRARG
jgi:ribosomal subunit interface protein